MRREASYLRVKAKETAGGAERSAWRKVMCCWVLRARQPMPGWDGDARAGRGPGPLLEGNLRCEDTAPL